MMETLSEIYKRHCVSGPDVGHGDKGGTHSYIEIYEKLLEPYRAKCTFMEIGLALGLSMEMWNEYFETPCTLVGVDLSIVFDAGKMLGWRPNDLPPGAARINLIAADATKPEFLAQLCELRFDVVIDDASHMAGDQVATFNLLKPRMRAGGIYIIEDILSPESSVPAFKTLHANCEVIDLRHVKGRFDDMLIVYRF